MHPALSVIFFTVMSGSGYGLLFLLGLLLAIQPHMVGTREALIALALGTAFAAAGLVSSMLHLGQPQRAWRALSQWRTSWLSREGVAALATFAPVLVLAVLLQRAAGGAAVRTSAAILVLCCAATVFCTARIYTSLKTISAWNHALVLPGYLLFAGLGGSVWLWALDACVAGGALSKLLPFPLVAAIFSASCALLKRDYWRDIATKPLRSSSESATGLGSFGRVRAAEAPHTEENYLTREMGFELARKHAARLRAIALVLFACTPALAAVLALYAVPRGSLTLQALLGVGAALSATAGIFVERWVFFAEAKHVVMLYYAEPTAAAS
jgi:DMSO reductase anchor subunit